MRIKPLDSAVLDLNNIASYYQRVGGNGLAIRMLQRIRQPVKNLANHPYLGTAYRKDLRRLVVADGLFIVFYRIEQAVIEIVHIRRAEQDLL